MTMTPGNVAKNRQVKEMLSMKERPPTEFNNEKKEDSTQAKQ
jgi:hypothetical protein